MWTFALFACHAPEPVETSTSPADTSNTDTSPPVDTAPVVLTAPTPAPEDRTRDFGRDQYGGTALGKLGGVVIGLPSSGQDVGDYLLWSSTSIYLWSPDGSTTWTGGVDGTITDPETGWVTNSQLGTQLLTPGDLTGDGRDDLVLFDGAPDHRLGASAFLFPGPIEGRLTVGSPGVVALTALGLPRRGAPCGDLSADGKPDLCLDTGVAFGPITADSGLDVTWPAAGPSEHVRLLGWRGGLALWDDAGQALRWFAAISPGELDLGTGVPWTSETGHVDDLATGDLDADGQDDLVVVRSNGLGATVHVLTDTAGGALSDAHASLTLPARPARTGWCTRPAEMCDNAALAVGDLDGDGQDDLVVGWGNEVRVFLGPIPAGELSTDRAVRWWTSARDSQTFGHAVLIHDAELDGDKELIVGDPDSESLDGQFRYGRVYVLEL